MERMERSRAVDGDGRSVATLAAQRSHVVARCDGRGNEGARGVHLTRTPALARANRVRSAEARWIFIFDIR